MRLSAQADIQLSVSCYLNGGNMEDIFTTPQELSRLKEQNRLLSDYERPVYESLLCGREGLSVLDVGCNDGSKTHDRFCDDRVKLTVGIDIRQKSVDLANSCYGSDKFRFYRIDAENELQENIDKIMKEMMIGSFDIINLSLVLLHTKDPKSVLLLLKKYLSENGVIIVIEADDTFSGLTPDKDGLFGRFLKLCSNDPFSGRRDLGRHIPALLEDCGYKNAAVRSQKISATAADSAKKRLIFETVFSYLPADFEYLLKAEPQNEIYKSAVDFINVKFSKLRESVDNADEISCGVVITTAENTAGDYIDGLKLERLCEDNLDKACRLCDDCVGKDMYTRDYLSDIMTDGRSVFYLLTDPSGEPAAYIFFQPTDLERIAAFTKLGESTVRSIAGDKTTLIHYRSVGVGRKFRGRRLSQKLMERMFSECEAQNIDYIFGACWRQGDNVPMKKVMEQCGFVHIARVEKLWYDEEQLYCPICKGRCSCSAEIYYKKFKGK